MRNGYRLPVDIQLDAYRESWKQDHEAAMACRDWEEVIGLGLAAFRQLDGREDDWRERVFIGNTPFDEADDRDHKERLSRWLESTVPLLERVLPDLEKRFATVEGAAALRERATEARQRLAEWTPPRLSAAVGLREMKLSVEEAKELRAFLANPKRPTEPTGVPFVREVDSSFFDNPK